LVGVEKLYPKAVKEVQKMSYETDTIENNDFGTMRSLVHRRSVLGYFVIYMIGCNENVVIDSRS